MSFHATDLSVYQGRKGRGFIVGRYGLASEGAPFDVKISRFLLQFDSY